jgi:DNA-binding MarR family transcriptional regulator
MKSRQEFVAEFMDIFELLTIKVMETDQTCVEISTANDINKADLALLGFIGKRGEVIMRDVAEYLDVPHSTATGVIDKLVRKGLLRRVNSETDRRTVKVCLTPGKGREIFEDFIKFRHSLGEKVLTALDEKDFKDMERIMKKMFRQLSGLQPEELKQ